MADLTIPALEGLSLPSGAPDVGPAQLFVATLLPGSSQRTALEAFARLLKIWQVTVPWTTFPWHRLTARETTFARAQLMTNYAPTTARMTIAMLRGVLRQAFRIGLMTAELYQRAILLPPIKLEDAPAGRMLTEAEVNALAAYTAAQPSPAGPLLSAVFAAGLGAGLRREELVVLAADALALDKVHLLVQGKGGRERVQATPLWVGKTIERWLKVRAKLKSSADQMFIQENGDSFTVYSMWKLITEAGKAAGCAHFTPHDLRRTFASRMMDLTDMAHTQRLMGHKSMTTTVRYDRRGAKGAEQAVTKLEGWGFEAPPATTKPKEEKMPKTPLREFTPEKPDAGLKVSLGEMAKRRLTTLQKAPAPLSGGEEGAGGAQPQGGSRGVEEQGSVAPIAPPASSVVEAIVEGGQKLVNRRIVRAPDFLRHGAPLDLAWARGQVRTLVELKVPSHKIVRALDKAGVRRGDGSELEVSDVERWAAV